MKPLKTASQLTATDLNDACGFQVEKTAAHIGARPGWLVAGNLRVILKGVEGLDVYAFDGTPARGPCVWETHFGAGVPADVIIAALRSAIR